MHHLRNPDSVVILLPNIKRLHARARRQLRVAPTFALTSMGGGRGSDTSTALAILRVLLRRVRRDVALL